MNLSDPHQEQLSSTPSRIVGLLELSALTVSLYSILSLMPTEEFSATLSFAFAAALIPGIAFRELSLPAVYHRVWRIATGLLLTVMVGAHLIGDLPSYIVLVGLCVFLLLQRWYRPRVTRNYLEIWALSALIFLVSGLKSSGPWGLLILIGWGISTAQLLCLLSFARTDRSVLGVTHDSGLVFSHSHRALWALIPLFALLSSGVFLVIPRSTTPSLTISNDEVTSEKGQTVLQSGFSDRISLSTMSRIKESERPVFTFEPIHTLRPLPITRFRTSVLDTFDGWTWSRSKDRRVTQETYRSLQIPPKSYRNAPTALEGLSNSEKTETLSLRIISHPSELVPLPESTTSVSSKMLPIAFSVNESGEVLRSLVSGNQTLNVTISTDTPEQQKVNLLRGEPREENLYIPPELEEVSTRLAHHLFQDQENLSPREKAHFATTYMRRVGEYTMDLTHLPEGPEGLKLFMSKSMKGHCELFATALALVLRSEGLPTRLITGYAIEPGTEPSGSETVVKESDAHAWVEVYIQDRGWIALDATPSLLRTSSPSPMIAGSIRSSLTQSIQDAYARFEGYGSDQQEWFLASMSKSIKSSSATWADGMLLRAFQRFVTNSREPFIIVFAFFLVFLNVTAAIVYKRFGQRYFLQHRLTNKRSQDLPELLNEILLTLNSQPKDLYRTGMSAGQLIEKAGARNHVDHVKIRQIIDLYTSWRFGKNNKSLADLRRLLREVRIDS